MRNGMSFRTCGVITLMSFFIYVMVLTTGGALRKFSAMVESRIEVTVLMVRRVYIFFVQVVNGWSRRGWSRMILRRLAKMAPCGCGYVFFLQGFEHSTLLFCPLMNHGCDSTYDYISMNEIHVLVSSGGFYCRSDCIDTCETSRLVNGEYSS